MTLAVDDDDLVEGGWGLSEECKWGAVQMGRRANAEARGATE